jgi:hypothetical protein
MMKNKLITEVTCCALAGGSCLPSFSQNKTVKPDRLHINLLDQQNEKEES